MRQIIAGEKSRPQICREPHLAEGVVSGWKEEYLERGEAAFTPKPVSSEQQLAARIAELERLCGQLAAENDALKKHWANSGRLAARSDYAGAAGSLATVSASLV